MDAIILASGETPLELQASHGASERALLPLEGRPMIAYVLDALRQTPQIGRIVVVGGEQTRALLPSLDGEALSIEAKGRMMDNAVAGVRFLGGDEMFICTCDIPLVTGATFEAMIEGTRARGLEAVYPIVRRDVVEAQLPHGKRTYGTIREGAFTAGNAVIVPARVVERLAELFDVFYRARKNPLAMARVMGASFLWKAATKRLSLADAERKISQMIGCNAGGLPMQDASIAFDVDKAEHLEIAAAVLRGRKKPNPRPLP